MFRIKQTNITMNTGWASEEGDLEYTKEVTAEWNMTRSMEGNAAADILSYLPTGEVVKTVRMVRA